MVETGAVGSRHSRGEPIGDLSKGGALKTLRTQRGVRYWGKTNPLRNLCGGRLHRWLTLWVLGRGRDSTPWPGWPVCRLILARFVPENCSSPSTDRVTMDTPMWPVRWKAEPLRRGGERGRFRGMETRAAGGGVPRGVTSFRSSNRGAQGGGTGGGE